MAGPKPPRVQVGEAVAARFHALPNTRGECGVRSHVEKNVTGVRAGAGDSLGSTTDNHRGAGKSIARGPALRGGRADGRGRKLGG